MLRTITYNLFGGIAYPAHRHNQDILARFRSQLPERIALELALYEPDIVTFQECPSEAFAEDVAARLNMHYAYFPGGWSGAVLTRFPILESESCPLSAVTKHPPECFTRHCGCAVLDTAAGPLHLYSAHLHPEHHDTRMAEITLMLEVMKCHIDGPGPLLLQGDLNHIDTTPEYHRWAAAGLQDAFAQAGEGERESWTSLAPRQALDYIWAGGALRKKATHCRTLNEGAFRPHAGNPASLALSDHLPVLAVFT